MHIIGAGGHAKVIFEMATALNKDVEGVWADVLADTFFNNYIVKADLMSFRRADLDQYIIAIGNNLTRKRIASTLLPTTISLMHPTSSISPSTKIGFGTVVMPNASINASSFIGKHVIINTNASIDHDCILADFVHISPQVGLAGNVCIGEGTHIGIGASIIQGINIGKWVTIGAGAIIIKDVPDHAVVVGNPGKIIKYNKHEE